MLSIKLFRNKPESIKKNLEKREFRNPEWVDKVVELDEEWRELVKERNELRQYRNETSEEISSLKGEKKEEKIKEMQEHNKKLEEVEDEVKGLKDEINHYLLRIPNLMHESVPRGEDESENVPIRKHGKKPEFGFEIRDHHELGRMNNWFDVERGAKVAGARMYYLKNELARLNFALFSYAIDYLISKGFEFMMPPTMCYEKCFQGTGFLPVGEEDIYKIEEEDLALIGTSEVPLASYHMNETLLKSNLPKKYCGFSACYRIEAGSHGKDTKGIFRVHQFNKVEMVAYTLPGKSWEMHEELIRTVEEFWQSLELHYRVVNICTGDLGVVASKKYDIEAWLPGQERYREVVSCSNCTSYQSRRLNTKYREARGKPRKDYVHTLNSTCVADTRALIAIIENNQREDGSVVVPKVLRQYMNNKKVIGGLDN